MSNPTSSQQNRPRANRPRPSYDGPEIGFDVRFFWCSCCMFWTLLTIILVAISIRDIDYGYWGVAYNTLTCTLEPEPFEQGKHIMRPETHLMIYNSLTIAFEFTGSSTLQALTADGLDVSMDLEIQYQLVRADLLDIVLEFGEEEKLTEFIRLVAADCIRDVAAVKTAQDFYENRAEVERDITNLLIADMANAKSHISIRLVQLRNVNLPDRLMDSILDKQRAESDITLAANENAGALTRAGTEWRTVYIGADIQILNANAEANSRLAVANQSSIAITERLTKRWEVWKDIKDMTLMSPTNFVNDYLKAVVISEVKDPLLGIRRAETQD